MTTTTRNGAIGLGFDERTGIATLTLRMEGKANKINDAFGEAFAEALPWAKARPGLKGIILASAHKDFCVGADIDMLYAARDPAAMYERVRALQTGYRALETCGVPVVAALTGSALGGGYELALSCHRRIAVDDPRIQVGLPEVMLGVIPGGGGTQRLPRLLGFQAAADIILQGKTVRAPKAKDLGLCDELCPDAAGVRAAAEQWIAANAGFQQPWDRAGYRFPPPAPGTADARDMLLVGSAMLYKKTAGAFLAPQYAISAMQEGCGLAFERGLEVEARYFARLATGDQAKDMIRTLWYHRTAAEKHQGLPGTDRQGIEKVGILGAGMMGGALGWVCAQAGYRVVLKDIRQPALDAAMAHCRKLTEERAKHLDAPAREALLGRIAPTLELGELRGCDLVIEAVFEDLNLKHTVTRETEPLLAPEGIWASNTSALPITRLAEASRHPERFIGMHFFSPVEQMPLLEIIMGKGTEEQTLARSLAFCRQIKKTPIVVNDGYAFYTTRVFSAYLMEGAQLVAEGHAPALVEWAARTAGMVIGPLQVFDEVTLTLVRKAMPQSEKFSGRKLDLAGFDLLVKMVDEHKRYGRAAGAGFYDYEGGRRQGIWPGLATLAAGKPAESGIELVGRRLLLAQAVEAVRALEDGVLVRKRDAEVGAIFGLGFAPNTGGPFSFLDRLGIPNAVALLRSYAEKYGPRCAPPALLVEMARKGERFFDAV
ncbi:MAG: enoyl-CoA hydratase/isomerase family protein [Deltaproteobacteria bacterium]|nr:enoyl-CoA hydratase/isomerase family protein [Deltaproteobacteria bacterium]